MSNSSVRDAGLGGAQRFLSIARDRNAQHNRSVYDSLYVNGEPGVRSARFGGDVEVRGATVTPETTGQDAVGLGTNAAAEEASTVAIGFESAASGTNSTAVGSAAITGPGGSVAIGNRADAVGADNNVQFGRRVDSGTNATLRFRTQTIARESWVGGGTTIGAIDNGGNIVREANPQTESLTMYQYAAANIPNVGTTQLSVSGSSGTRGDAFIAPFDGRVDRIGIHVDPNAGNDWTAGTLSVRVDADGATVETTAPQTRAAFTLSEDYVFLWTGLTGTVSQGELVEFFVISNATFGADQPEVKINVWFVHTFDL